MSIIVFYVTDIKIEHLDIFSWTKLLVDQEMLELLVIGDQEKVS